MARASGFSGSWGSWLKPRAASKAWRDCEDGSKWLILPQPVMRRLLAAAVFAGMSFATVMPARSDLGGADITGSGFTTGNTYDAWCGNDFVDCKVQFSDGRLIVDEGSGILASQIQSVVFNRICRNYALGMPNCFSYQYNKEWAIKYRDSSGILRTGKISFRHERTANAFKQDFEIWQDSVMRPVGPSIQIVK